ncbi:MAG: HEPN domain-containing protein [Desulfurococcales archaeon]|nr:HEPN domain-containing protein [Desulfurococcales archaeon]
MLLERDFDYSTFHSQQATEKALKALLIAYHKRPPRTHNIGILINELELIGVETKQILQAKILTDYAVEARYPDFEDKFTTEEALELARKTLEWVREKLRELRVEC